MAAVEHVAIIDDLSVAFGGKKALAGVSLKVPYGGITVLLGRSGVGKTTLLRSLNRLNECFPDCQTEGSIKMLLQGRLVEIYRDISSLTNLRRQVGMVFQSPNVLPISIEKNLLLILKRGKKKSKTDLAQRMEKVLTEVELWDEVKDRLRHSAETLSGGQQQRLCLARVLALEPEVLLLDEPTSSLDFQATKRIEELLARLKDRYAIIAVSHSLSQTHRIADHIIVMPDRGSTKALEKDDFENPELLRKVVEEIF